MPSLEMPVSVGGPHQTVDSLGLNDQVWKATRAFIGWLDRNGVESYDPYDLWGTRYGLLARRLYYGKNPLGTLLVAPLVATEVLFPGVRPVFVKKQRFATAEAQLALAFLHLYAATRDKTYLARAERHVRGLLELSIPGYSGHCWGYPFDWQNNRGLWPRNTPFITSTPYCYEAFVGMGDATGEQKYLDVAASIAQFVAFDLRDTRTSDLASAGSYSPIDSTQVVNASAYRAFVLLDACRRFGVQEYGQIGLRNLCFVLESQREDGAWLYGLNSPSEAFIDHFHTCFVLKNLQKCRGLVDPETAGAIESAINRGWSFYRRELFYEDDTPKGFALEPRTQLARLEMYNVAEAISLGTLLRDSAAGAADLAARLGLRAIREYQLSAGYFVTRVYRSRIRHTMPFLRWPQAQMFLALCGFLLVRRGCVLTNSMSHI